MPPLSEFPSPAEDGAGEQPPEMRVAPPGPMSKSAAARLAQVECPSFGRRRSARDLEPIVLASGKGVNVYDVDGNRYVDLAAGFGSVLLGHAATAVQRAMEGQSDRLVQALGDVYAADAKIALLERLASLHPGLSPRVVLTQSGGDAVTAAIKTATLATGRPGVVAFEGCYHGLGYAPLAACGLRESYRAPFAAQLNAHVSFAPYARTAADVDRALSAVEGALRGGQVGAVLLEPILGRGGCVVPPDAFVHGVCEIAHRHEALVVADEIWTALGRSGAMVRTTEIRAAVDVLCFGKGLGGGLPISACVAPDAIMQAWVKPSASGAPADVVHTSTHAGLPLACATAVATLDSLRFRQLVPKSRELGARAKEALRAELAGKAGVVDIRGEGLMIGIELGTPELAARAMRGMLARGYITLTGGAHGEVMTWTPPLNIPEELLRSAARALGDALAS